MNTIRRSVYPLLVLVSLAAAAGAQPLGASFPFTIANADTAIVGLLPTATQPKGIDSRVTSHNGHFYIGTGESETRLRFYGTELYYTAMFLDGVHAERLAKHLHKLGFNAVRLIGTDYNYWADASLQLGPDATSSVTPSPTQFAKLDTLLYYFRQNDIYAFLSIHDFHYYSAADGVIRADSQFYWGMWQEYLDPAAARLQKEWARTLLTHVNPLTGKRLVDDPVVAAIEFSSEQLSLCYAWTYGLLNFVDSTHAYPSGNTINYSLSRHIDTLWTQYLLRKYGSEGAISAHYAGITPSAANLVEDGSFEDIGSAAWSVFVANGAIGTQLLFTPAIDSQYCTLLHLGSLSANPGYGDAYMYNVSTRLKRDSLYECSLWMKVRYDQKVNVTSRKVYLAISDYTTGAGSLSQEQVIDTVWRKYTFRFRSAGNGPQYIVLYFGNQLGDILLDGVNIHRVAETGLFAGEHVANDNLFRPIFGQTSPLIPALRFQDMFLFYDSLCQNYYGMLRRFIRDSLKSDVLTTNYRLGSWGNVMDVYQNRTSDFVGGTEYIDYFTNRPSFAYSDSTWIILQTSFLNQTYNGPFGLLEAEAIDQKPYIYASFLTPYISQHNQEVLPYITSYASLQDWDGIFLSYYAIYREDLDSNYNRHYLSYDLAGNGTMLAAMPSASDAFRNFKISAPSETIQVTHTDESMRSCLVPGKYISYYDVPGYLDPGIGTIFKVRQSFGNPTEKQAAEYPYNPTDLDTAVKVSETNEITWDSHNLWLTTIAPKFESAVGYFVHDTVDLGGIRFARRDRQTDALSVSLQGFDTASIASSTNLFLSIGSRSQNSGTIWDADSLSVRNRFGLDPQRFAALSLQFWIRSDSSRVVCHSLDSSGAPMYYSFDAVRIPSTNIYTFTIDQTVRSTPWFWIEMTNAVDAVHASAGDGVNSLAIYPNPAREEVTASVTSARAGRVTIKIYDDLGRLRESVVDGELSSGTSHISIATGDLEAGHYIVRCDVGSQSLVQSLTLVK